MLRWKCSKFTWLKAIGIGIILFAFLRSFFFVNYVVEGKSMMPTLQNGNLVMVSKLNNHWKELKRFDIVIFHANKKEDFVKRIIGLPGDKIEYKHDVLFVNNHRMKEPYLEPLKAALTGRYLTGDFTLQEVTGVKKVPNGYLFVLGDNRPNSWDSRYFSFIKMTSVVGKVDLRYWPLNEWNTEFYQLKKNSNHNLKAILKGNQ